MKLSDFDYNLDESLIAQLPSQKRENSRLMHLNRTNKNIEHKFFYDIVDMLDENDENSIIKLQIAPVSQQRAIKEINTIENIDRAEVIDDYIYIYSKKDKHVEQDIFDICCQNEWYIRSLIPVELTIEEIIKKHLIN